MRRLGRRKSVPKRSLGGVKIIQPENILRQKVGTGGLPPALIRAAQVQMEEISRKILLPSIVMENLEWQKTVLKNFKANSILAPVALKDVQDAWSLMKGNTASFGFSLAAKIASNLNDFLDTVTVLNADTISIIEVHENAIHAVVKNNVRDKQDPIGQAILDELQRANARYVRKHSIVG